MTSATGLRGWTLITGASEGLGREFAILAAAEGRDLILAARQGPKMEALAEELRTRHKIAVEIIPTDLADSEAVELLWRRASSRRRIDILVNNAGLGAAGPFASDDLAREVESIRVNVLALTILMKRAAPHMLAAGGGQIMNVASVAAFTPGPNMAVYHATKAYVLSLSEAVAEELRGQPVTITAFCPGATKTQFAKVAGMEEMRLFRAALRLPTARSVAVSGWRAMRRGKRVHVTGLLNKGFAFLPRFGPRFLMPWITGLFLK